MKILKRMLLIKWYFIEHQIINFDSSTNFMTGKNASGKSTIIDALQIVMLGDTRGTFFNKAANDKGGRTLDGYLRGELSDDGDVSVKNVRNGRFTSYIAVEFYDTIDKKSFTCGVVFDSYKDAPTEHMFFIINDKIPENHFVDENENIPMDYKKLKSYLTRKYSQGKYSVYKESNKSYQNDLLAKMGAIKPKFFNLFKKAVTFTPINNIEGFISEYVCDVSNTIDVYKMQENIRQYKQLEKEAIIMEERKQMLEGIENIYQSYRLEEQREYMQNFLIKRSDLQITINTIEKQQKEKQEKTKIVEELEKQKEELETKQKGIKGQLENKKAEKAKSDINLKNEELTRKIKDLTEKIENIDRTIKNLIRDLRNKIAKWKVNIEEFLQEHNNIPQEDEQIIKTARQLKDNITYLLSINENNIEELEKEVLSEIKEQMDEINSYANKIYYQKEIEEKQKTETKQIREQEVNNLKSGIKPYKPSLIAFKNTIETELEKKIGEKVELKIVADLLEMKDMKWKNSIEAYINHQMFYFIIEPKYYLEVANIYRKISQENQYTGFGIIDIEKIAQTNPIIEKNSLAEELEIKDKYARIYIDYLLGKVIKCETVEELRNYKTAITADGMLYKNYVLRKIADKHNEFKFIGANSIQEQINIKQEEIETISKELESIAQIKQITGELKKAGRFNEEEISYIQKDIEEIKTRPEKIEEKHQYQKERDALDLTWLDKMSKEIEELEKVEENIGKQLENNLQQRTILNNDITEITQTQLPQKEQEKIQKSETLKNLYNTEWIEKFGEPRFQKELQNKRAENIFKNFSDQIERTKNQKEQKFQSLEQARQQYTNKFQLGYSIFERTNNIEFQEDLKRIKDIELPQYIEKIKDSEHKAYEQFRNDFIAKMKANIDEVVTQIEELNTALENSQFGKDKYQFKVKPKQEYRRFYDMITDSMLMEGRNLWSDEFNNKYKNEIEELFKKLTSSDMYDEIYEKNIKMYTDYKTYLSFDLVVTSEDGNIQHLSKTLNKKSGGETQTPFYISILASFAQIYRINKNRNDNTLRLIVFDEAFNKMDEERMEESLKLLKKFQFQALIAAPSEKAGEIIPIVNKTLCVINKGRHTIVTEWDEDKNALM